MKNPKKYTMDCKAFEMQNKAIKKILPPTLPPHWCWVVIEAGMEAMTISRGGYETDKKQKKNESKQLF